MANKKYELMKDDTIKANGKTLYRIKALKNINGEVKAGDLGGYIESELNLSTKMDESWVYDNAMVFDSALVVFHAHVRDKAMVYGNAEVIGEGGLVEIRGNAKVYGNTRVYGGDIYGMAELNMNKASDAEICDKAKIIGDVTVYGGFIGGKAFFNVKDGEGLAIGSVEDYKPSKLVEIKDGKQCQEVFDAAGLEYDDIEGESLPDGGVSGPWARRE